MKQFCLGHRLPVDHNCLQIKQPKPIQASGKVKVANIIGQERLLSIEQKKKADISKMKNKKSKTVAKVLEMQLKMKAEGDAANISIESRVYFNVTLEMKDKRVVPMFFNKSWTVGKVIDLIAKTHHVKNENNIAGAPKLGIYSSEGGFADSGFDSDPLETVRILEEVVADESVIISNFATVYFRYNTP